MSSRLRASDERGRRCISRYSTECFDNGLQVLVLPWPAVPVVVCDVHYPVGSANEPPGKSGLAHFVEHMLFKGNEAVSEGRHRSSGLSRGWTGQRRDERGHDALLDCASVESVGAALKIEADRMRGAQFDDREIEAERRVILEERKRAGKSDGPARPDASDGELPDTSVSKSGCGLARRFESNRACGFGVVLWRTLSSRWRGCRCGRGRRSR